MYIVMISLWFIVPRYQSIYPYFMSRFIDIATIVGNNEKTHELW